uniref:Large ribosomal subunit protein uL4 n=1 Tax=Candidatus Kentrum sp. FM TaxID=2126340 RepID=A0A450RXH1_9GAMM|nr:MAG: large subunit ribosomal protein L4 [Candidatus Kentron sp. FM]VFJ63929.1 MAG: large subunit ribosomal protein L4 [Candidatus Kentron sp. FM]VFK06970.1 MAG: large subunit ribosomal protein L4 [Candidatus Kentron sp. FM]
MELTVFTEDLSEAPIQSGSDTEQATAQGNITVPDDIFAVDFNEPLIHQLITAYLAAARTGTRKQKNRSDVRGGGAKPYRQKGTGRARAGTTRSPLWRGGGVTFAARPKNYAQKLNKKMYRAALRSMVSELIRQGCVMVMPDFSVSTIKTREIASRLHKLGLTNVLIITEQQEENLRLSVRNLKWADALDAGKLDPVSLIAYEKILITVPGLRKLEERLR